MATQAVGTRITVEFTALHEPSSGDLSELAKYLDVAAKATGLGPSMLKVNTTDGHTHYYPIEGQRVIPESVPED